MVIEPRLLPMKTRRELPSAPRPVVAAFGLQADTHTGYEERKQDAAEC
jgi:hypothetical protein